MEKVIKISQIINALNYAANQCLNDYSRQVQKNEELRERGELYLMLIEWVEIQAANVFTKHGDHFRKGTQ